ncbi:hypothetical protein [Bradyrhizobium valentinum]|uniref:Uncharacterized protein n=1 Tax=Bradyrhizobium valentinum TaxID=1518501 RepID=A0A0R3KNC6_9BRAD|nr:hypothetical protein [Bradyrhizobium valentinum]KRQ97073.1 hypothetical protein CP49_28895 [Bradyrhizobium valentinum]
MKVTGNPDLVAFKRHVIHSAVCGLEPSTVALRNDHFACAIFRVTLRQVQALEQTSAVLAAWLSAWDELGPVDADDPSMRYIDIPIGP